MSAAVENRASGSFSIARNVTDSSAGGIDGTSDLGGVGVSWTCR